MTTLATLVVGLRLDASNFEQNIRGAKTSALDFAKNAASFATGGLLVKGVEALAGAFGDLKAGLVDGNAEFERYETQFGVLLGSTDAAKDRLEDLAEFGANTPFELPEVVRADKILQGFGLHADDVAERFGMSGEQIRTVAGDVAAGTGASFEEISGYLGKFSSGATGEAIARFQELGIVTREQLAGMGLEFSKSGELLTPVNDAMDTLLVAMQSKFGGMMDAQSGTLEGMLSNLDDWKAGTLRTLGEPIFEVVKDQMGSLLEFINRPEVGAGIKSVAEGLATGIGGAMTFIGGTALPMLQQGWAWLEPNLQKGWMLAQRVSDAFGEGGLGAAVEELGPTLKAGGDLIGQQMGVWTEQFLAWVPGATVQLISEAGNLLGSFLTWIYDNREPILETLGEWTSAFGEWALTRGLPALGGALIGIASGLWSLIADKFQSAFAADSLGAALVDSIKQALLDQWDGFKSWFLDLIISSVPGASVALGLATGSYTVPKLTSVQAGVQQAVSVVVQGSVIAERDLAETIRQQVEQRRSRGDTF